MGPLVAGALLAATALSLPDGNALVRELAQKQRRWEEILNSYTYDVDVVREELDKDDRATKRESRRFEVFYVKGRPLRRLVAEDGRPLGADRQAKVDQDVKEKVAAINQERVALETPAVRLSQILERYDFRAVGREAIDGRPAIVLEFTALPGSRPLPQHRGHEVLPRPGGVGLARERHVRVPQGRRHAVAAGARRDARRGPHAPLQDVPQARRAHLRQLPPLRRAVGREVAAMRRGTP
jgi:hypothetical protein